MLLDVPAVKLLSFSMQCVWYWVHEMLKAAGDRNSGMPFWDASFLMLYSSGGRA